MALDLTKINNWNVPSDWLRIKTLDAHTAGEPLRIILEGYPELPGKTILEKRKYAKENFEHIRKALMWEPRGHADMYGAIITEPEKEDSDFGVLFIHNEGFSTMCGHAIIAMTKVFIETGIIEAKYPETVVKIDVPSGQITSHAQINKKGEVENVAFHNVPSFVLCTDQVVDVPGMGKVKYDVSFGGAFYAYVNADELGISLEPNNYNELIDKGMKIKNAVMAQRDITHPYHDDLSFLYGTIFIGSPIDGADSRNVCIFAEGEVDRSPTGSGVAARMALHYKKGEIGIDSDPMQIESIISSRMKGSVHKVVEYGPYKDAVIPQVEGIAYITGVNEFLIDPNDPLKGGFIFR